MQHIDDVDAADDDEYVELNGRFSPFISLQIQILITVLPLINAVACSVICMLFDSCWMMKNILWS